MTLVTPEFLIASAPTDVTGFDIATPGMTIREPVTMIDSRGAPGAGAAAVGSCADDWPAAKARAAAGTASCQARDRRVRSSIMFVTPQYRKAASD